MLTKADQELIDALVQENRELRETIRELLRENVASEKYWKEFVLKVVQKVTA